MAFDGITLNKIISELQILVKGKVNQIYIPNNNNIIISVYNGSNYSLNIDTSATNYRIHLTKNSKPNPLVAPNFCMILRKYLVNGRISKIYMTGLERICYIDFECFNEMNDKITRTLAIELMGKYSNVTLLNENYFIIDALKKFEGNDTSRSIMPARKYIVPTSDKNEFFELSRNEFVNYCLNSASQNAKKLDDTVCNLINGISKQFINSACDDLQIDNSLSFTNLEKIYDYISSILNDNCKNGQIDNYKNNYSVFLNQKNNLSNNANSSNNVDDGKNYLLSNIFLDNYYSKKLDDETYINYRNNLLKILNATLDKIERKLANINEKIENASNMDDYKIAGEVLISNIYRFTENYEVASSDQNKILITEDTKYVSLENFYDNNNLIKIEINPKISISKNAEKYFKKYNKAKNTIEISNIQKIETQHELSYIASLVNSLNNCKTIEQLDFIYNEISENILFNTMNLKKNKVNKKIKDVSGLTNYMKFKIDDYDVFIGKNNKQNDYLTFKVAHDNDYWFHTKDIHGSHLILRCNGETPKIETITKCAELCAYYSKAKFSSHVPVDYTLVKNVKKPNGADAGFVIYTTNKTIYVNPKSYLEK